MEDEVNGGLDQNTETATSEGTEAQNTDFSATDTTDPGTTISEDQAHAQTEESQREGAQFLQGSTLDPRQLPPEIQPIFKRMQAAYTKKMQEAANWRQKAETVDKFYTDPQYAFQTLAQWAANNGYTIAPVGSQAAQTIASQQKSAAASAVAETIKQNLPDELKWMADSMGPALDQAVQGAVQKMLQPLAQQAQQQQYQVQSQEWDSHAAKLSEVAPGWEEHEGAMGEILDFLQGSQLNHPKYGSKLQVLYNLATGNAAATAQVAKRFTQAAKNRPSSGMTTGRTSSNLADRIRNTKRSSDAFRLAAEAADASLGR